MRIRTGGGGVGAGRKAGVRHEGVTEATGKLNDMGAIKYRRGRIKLLDRPRLEQLCCECYSLVKRETDRLLPLTAQPRN